MMIGNKSDLCSFKECDRYKDTMTFIATNSIPFYETSAVQGESVLKKFDDALLFYALYIKSRPSNHESVKLSTINIGSTISDEDQNDNCCT